MTPSQPTCPMRPASPDATDRRQQGFALLAALFILVIISLLSVGMMRSFGLQARIAGNTLEKQRSLQSAETALQYGEWWVSQGSAGTGVSCTTLYSANTASNMQTCTAPLTPATATLLPWSTGGVYTPPNMTVAAGGGLSSGASGTAGDVNYAAAPTLYVAYLGLGPDGHSMLYQITAAGYGGSTTSASVVQSVYQMGSRVSDIGGL